MTHSPWKIQALTLIFLLTHSLGLNTDGVILLTFKYSILSDPLGVLVNWNARDQNPCSWQGVTCGDITTMTNSSNSQNSISSSARVTTLSLPDSQLLGSISADIGMIPHLRSLNLANNSINDSIPLSLLRASELETLDLSNNMISGELSELAGGLTSLKILNLSDNALSGKIPNNLTNLGNLTILSLKSNYFSGDLPSNFGSVQVLDLSSNLINGSLPVKFSGNNLRYLNVSYNRISGEIPAEFANEIPTDAKIDLSFNNFTGQIPATTLFTNQEEKSYSGNNELCGNPLKTLCLIPSAMSNPPNETTSDSPPAIAAIPKSLDSPPGGNSTESTRSGKSGLRLATIVAIIVGDVVGVAIVAVIILYIYQKKKNRVGVSSNTKKAVSETYEVREYDWSSSSSEEESRGIRGLACLRKQVSYEDESSDSTCTKDREIEDNEKAMQLQSEKKKNGALVTVDGEKELEIETLLKASAYILGATSSSIMYKAVLEDGTTMAVRRIGENGIERFRDFENQIRVIAKLVHPNLVRIRGFYWGADEKLIIYDFVPNGSLANARYRKAGSSPIHLPWEVRLKIAKGVARGLTYIHDKKHVHGNLKPSNILLGLDMEPKIGDFGLERLVTGESGYKPGSSARNFGSKRSTASRESFQDNLMGSTPSPSPSSLGGISPYYAPESLRSIKPNAKWDVFSFGVILLELLTGKVIVSDELGPGPNGLVGEERNRVLRMADVAIRAELEGREDALLALLKLGFNCLSTAPQKRPNMKEALQALDKFPSSSSNSISFY